jgi:hypothetical protein
MEVLEQVSTLFADHPDLLEAFTHFLPDSVQEQAKERLERAARESEIRKAVSRLLRSYGGAWRVVCSFGTHFSLIRGHRAPAAIRGSISLTSVLLLGLTGCVMDSAGPGGGGRAAVAHGSSGGRSRAPPGTYKLSIRS